MEKAIKRAIEGGWEDKMFGMDCETDTFDHALLDPLFWQALGKAERWEESTVHSCIFCDGNDEGSGDYLGPEWKWQMHRFIDHIIEGKPIDTFFDELLKP